MPPYPQEGISNVLAGGSIIQVLTVYSMVDRQASRNRAKAGRYDTIPMQTLTGARALGRSQRMSRVWPFHLLSLHGENRMVRALQKVHQASEKVLHGLVVNICQEFKRCRINCVY